MSLFILSLKVNNRIITQIQLKNIRGREGIERERDREKGEGNRDREIKRERGGIKREIKRKIKREIEREGAKEIER